MPAVQHRLPESSSLIGQTISRYCITEKLGGGGMGVVYKAEDELALARGGVKFPITAISDDERMVLLFTSIADPGTSTYCKKVVILKTYCLEGESQKSPSGQSRPPAHTPLLSEL